MSTHLGLRSFPFSLLALLGCVLALGAAPSAQIKINQRFARSISGDVTAFELTPDGSQAVYLADQEIDEVLELFRAPLDGSAAPVRINDPFVGIGQVRAFDWSDVHGTRPIVLSPLGERVLYYAYQAAAGSFQLYSARLDGPASPIVLATGFTPSTFVEARIDPTGHRAVYRAGFYSYGRALYSAPLDGSAPAVPLSAPSDHLNVTNFVVAPDGAQVFYTFEETPGIEQLWRVPADGSAAPALFVGGKVRWFELTADGTRVVYATSGVGGVKLFSRRSDGSAPAIRLNDGTLNQTALGGLLPISPDGTRVVYRESGRFGVNNHGLFSVPIDGSADPVRINRNAACPEVEQFWITPDSARVVFRGFEADGRACLYSAPIGGAAPVRLHPEFGNTVELQFFGQLSADSARAVYVADAEQDERRDLYSAPLDGGQAPIRLSPLGLPSSSVFHWFVHATPAGARIVFAQDTAYDEVYELYSAPLDGSQAAVKLTPPPHAAGNSQSFQDLEFTPDGSTVAYLAAQALGGAFELWRVPVDAAQPSARVNTPMRNGPITSDVFEAGFGLEGVRVYGASVGAALQVFSAKPGRDPRVRPIEPVLVPDYSVANLVMSRDRERVVYRERSSDHRDYLFSAPADASAEPIRISALDGYGVGSFFVESPVGAWMLAERYDHALLRMPIDGSEPQRVLTTVRTLPESLVDPLGNWVVFRTEPYPNELFSVPSIGGTALRLDPGNGFSVQFGFQISLDGLFVFFLVDDGPGGSLNLYGVPIDGSAAPTRISAPLRDVGGHLSQCPNGLAFLARESTLAPFHVYGIQVPGGAPVRLSGTMVSGGNAGTFEFSAGVPRLVYLADQETDGVMELFSVLPGSGSPPIKLNAPLTAGGDVTSFRVSPDGAWVIYRADQTVDEGFELHEVPTDGHRPAERLDPAAAVGDVSEDYVVTPTLVAWTGNTSAVQTSELFAATIDAGRPPRKLNGNMTAGGNVTQFLVNPDSSSVLFIADQERDDVFELYEAVLTKPLRRAGLR